MQGIELAVQMKDGGRGGVGGVTAAEGEILSQYAHLLTPFLLKG